MSRPSLERLAALIWALLSITYVANLAIGSMTVVLLVGYRADVGTALALDATGITLLILVTRFLVLDPNPGGRLFVSPKATASGALGCAVLRVCCLYRFVVSLYVSAGECLFVQHAVSLRGAESPPPLYWLVHWSYMPLVTLALFYAAPWVMNWIASQVDRGVMWWSPFLRWLTR